MSTELKPLVDKSLERFDENGMQTVFCLAPFGNSETRAERIARWEAKGDLDPNCLECLALFYPHPTISPFAPTHWTSSRCRSGGRPHCTCPTCWG